MRPSRTATFSSPARALTGVVIALTLFAACGGGDDKSAVPANAAPSGSNADTGDTDTDTGDTDTGDITMPDGTDCDQLREDLTLIGIAVQLLPQMQTGEQITDTFVLGDLDEKRAAIDAVRGIATADGNEFLDDIAAGLDVIEAGRSGDAAAAVTELNAITGGPEGVTDWLMRQLSFNDSMDALGC